MPRININEVDNTIYSTNQLTNDNIVYPGSIEPLSFKEQGYHGAVEGVLDEDGLKLGYLDVSNSIFIEKDYIIEEKFNFYDLKDKIENEWTVKNKKNTKERLELSKYCPTCKKHTNHKETK